MESHRRKEFDFCVYLLASRSRQLYVGVTNSLRRRVGEHRQGRAGTYCARYRITRLVYFEHFEYVWNAIAREKELKDWNRAKKVALIEAANPTWVDLAEDWVVGRLRIAEEPAKTEADPSAALRDDKGEGGGVTRKRGDVTSNDWVDAGCPMRRGRG
jgi:putative endonuclease